MTDVDKLIAARAMNDLKESWGGRLPTWGEFKNASRERRVKVNQGVANDAIMSPGVPRSHRILFGGITPWAMFLIPILSVILFFLGKCSGWAIPVGAFGAYYLYKVTLAGACDGIRYGAEENEAFYQALISQGAFLFGPPK